jgi:hypothetical protein
MQAIDDDRKAQQRAGFTPPEVDAEFAGATRQQAHEWADHGCPDAARDAARFIDHLRDQLPQVIRNREGWDVVGERFDVGRMLEGEPEYWNTPVPTRATPIRLLVGIGASGYTDEKDLRRRAAACAALASLLRDAGESVELVAGITSSQYGNGSMEATWTVSEAGADFSLDSAAYWLGHPASYRHFGFSVIDMLLPRVSKAWGYRGNYGSAVAFTPEVTSGYDLVIDSTCADNWNSNKKTLAWITRQLDALTNQTQEV